jgi:hypothetical protein
VVLAVAVACLLAFIEPLVANYLLVLREGRSWYAHNLTTPGAGAQRLQAMLVAWRQLLLLLFIVPSSPPPYWAAPVFPLSFWRRGVACRHCGDLWRHVLARATRAVG